MTLPDGSTLYVHPEDQKTGRPELNGIVWGGTGIDIPGVDNKSTFAEIRADFDGEANTQAIVSALGDGDYAAKVCADLVCGGYDDWYLPAVGELIAIYNQVGGELGVNNFNGEVYWGSTEYDGYNAAGLLFNSGSIRGGAGIIGKAFNWISCRCVRK